MNKDEDQDEVGLGVWIREYNCVVENKNIQRMVYFNVVQLYKVHKQEKKCNMDKKRCA